MFLVDEMGFLLSLFFFPRRLVSHCLRKVLVVNGEVVGFRVIYTGRVCTRYNTPTEKGGTLFSLIRKKRVEAGIVEEAFLKAINCFLNAGSFFFSS